jgi:hypothetical protein
MCRHLILPAKRAITPLILSLQRPIEPSHKADSVTLRRKSEPITVTLRAGLGRIACLGRAKVSVASISYHDNFQGMKQRLCNIECITQLLLKCSGCGIDKASTFDWLSGVQTFLATLLVEFCIVPGKGCL